MRMKETMSVMKCWKLKNRWRGYNWLSRSQKAESQSHGRKSKEQTDLYRETSKRLQNRWCWLVLEVGDASGRKTRVWVQFSSVTQSCLTLCDPMNCSTPGLPVHHQLPEFTQTHVHRVLDAIQPSHPRSSPSPPAPNPSQHQSLFQWVNSSHEVAKVLEFQL